MAVPGRSLAVLVLTASAAVLLLVLAGAGGAEAQIPSIVVQLEEADKDQTAFPTETQNDILEFAGCLTLNRPIWPPGTSVVIEITMDMPDLDTPWEISIDPPTHTFTASESQAFSAQLTVPANLPATTTIGESLVFTAATDDILLYDSTPDTARVSIAQYYRIGRQYSTKPIDIEQGDIVTFNFTVQNTGNGVDTFTFEVANEAELLFAGITHGPISSERIEMGEEADVTVQVSADAEALEGQFHFNLTITSEGSKTDPNLEKPVTSSIEWNIVIKPSIETTILDNIWYIIIGVVVVVVVVIVVFLMRKRKLSREELEDMEEEAPPPKKKRKKRPAKKAIDDADEDSPDED
ncbi:MAG: hypothetical protein JSW25_06005 [Thermoplasmata archaeon]|nr:MAG: hypothetical protein JSW25_06005 [Thermoplasmata archaeon]